MINKKRHFFVQKIPLKFAILVWIYPLFSGLYVKVWVKKRFILKLILVKIDPFLFVKFSETKLFNCTTSVLHMSCACRY